jgi:hypothetical protein
VQGAFFKQPLGADCIGLESDFGDAVADRVTALIERGYKPWPAVIFADGRPADNDWEGVSTARRSSFFPSLIRKRGEQKPNAMSVDNLLQKIRNQAKLTP